MRERGFTLLEILIMLGVGAIAGSILVGIIVQSNSLFLQQGAGAAQGISLNDSVSQISEAIVLSSSVASTYTPPGGSQLNSDQNTLILKIPTVNSSGTVIDNVFDYVVIRADPQKPNVLKKNLYPDIAQSVRKSENKVLATSLSSITFNYYDLNGLTVTPAAASKISFTINLSEKAGYGDKSRSASGQVNLKNK